MVGSDSDYSYMCCFSFLMNKLYLFSFLRLIGRVERSESQLLAPIHSRRRNYAMGQELKNYLLFPPGYQTVVAWATNSKKFRLAKTDCIDLY